MYLLQEEGNGADMVFMTMGDDQSLDLGLIFYQIGIIRNDVVDAEKIIFRKQDTAVDNDNFIIMLDAVHVLADFAKAADRIDQRICIMIYICFGEICIRDLNHRTGRTPSGACGCCFFLH